MLKVGSKVQHEDCDVANVHGNELGARASSRDSGSFFQVASGSAGGARRLRVGAFAEGAQRFRDVADDSEDSPELAFHCRRV